MFVLFFAVLISVLAAQPEKAQKESLRGLQEVRVVVDAPRGDTPQEDLLAHQIEVDIGMRILQAGIRLVELQGWRHKPGAPFLWPRSPEVPTLYVQVKPQKAEGHTVYSVRVEVKREDPESGAMVLLWHAGSMGRGGMEKEQGVRKTVAGYVKAFIRDYRAMNPR